MRLWVAPIRCPASFKLSIASSRTVSSSAMAKAYGQAASSDHLIIAFSPARSLTSAERSRAVSLVTSFGSCGPIYDSDTPRRASRLTSHTEQRLPIPHPQKHQTNAQSGRQSPSASNHQLAYQEHHAQNR